MTPRTMIAMAARTIAWMLDIGLSSVTAWAPAVAWPLLDGA